MYQTIPGWAEPPPRNGSGYDRPCMGRYDKNCTRWDPLQAEYDRARGLCDLVKQENLGGLEWGYEGVVRMNAGFELIWCNFSSPSARLVSWLNTSAPLLDRYREDVTPSPIGFLFRNPFIFASIYDWYRAAAKRFGFVGSEPGRGEARVRIDSARLFTFYDPALVHQEAARVQHEVKLYNLTEQGHWKGLVNDEYREDALRKLARRRRWQRTMNVSESDGLYMRAAVLERMRNHLELSPSSQTHIDWVLTAKEIVTFYSGAIQDLQTRFTAKLSNFDT